MRPVLAALPAFALLASGCVTAPVPVEKQPFPSFDEARGGAPRRAGGGVPGASAPVASPKPDAEPTDVPSLDATAYAKRHPRPEFCEEAARRLQRSSRDKAWEVLKACVAKGRFTVLARLVDGGWTDDLRTRSDASILLAKVIAARGGDVTGDLGQIRKERIPVFPIAPAMSHPDLYKGRLVLFRGEVRDVKLAGSKATAKLAEFAIGNDETYVGEGVRRTERSSGSARYSNSNDYSSQVSGSSTTTWQKERRLTSNTMVETGLEVLAKLNQADPFFEPGRQFVVLARFDSVREEEGEDIDTVNKLAVVSVIGYYEPSAAMVE